MYQFGIVKSYSRYNNKIYDDKQKLVKEKIDLIKLRDEIAVSLKKLFITDIRPIEGTVGGAANMVYKNYYDKIFKDQMEY